MRDPPGPPISRLPVYALLDAVHHLHAATSFTALISPPIAPVFRALCQLSPYVTAPLCDSPSVHHPFRPRRAHLHHHPPPHFVHPSETCFVIFTPRKPHAALSRTTCAQSQLSLRTAFPHCISHANSHPHIHRQPLPVHQRTNPTRCATTCVLPPPRCPHAPTATAALLNDPLPSHPSHRSYHPLIFDNVPPAGQVYSRTASNTLLLSVTFVTLVAVC